MNVDGSLHLPDDQVFPTECEKTGIALHHTVGGTAKSTYEYWLSKRDMVGTAFIVERDGTIFEVFDRRFWAWQFGLGWSEGQRVPFEKRFIGIEIASEGGLKEVDGALYCYDSVSPRTKKKSSEAFDYGKWYRAYRYFDKYEPAQIASVVALVDSLCTEFNIPRIIPDDPVAYYGDRLVGFRGIIGHANVRADKTDPIPDPAFWNEVINGAHLTRTRIDESLDALFNMNIAELRRMNPAAGSLVKGLLFELQRAGRDTYIRLSDAEPAGHAVDYAMVRGNPALVGQLGIALGFKSVTESHLEVYSG
jgi:N-acetyl-anhydromuramyl-L-alanine amidase AmpD